MIQFETVAYSYRPDGSSPVLQDVSFTIADGEQVVIIGANGCGKSTLGMLLSGILTPQSGTISVQVGTDAEKRPVIGFLFQDPDNGLVATTVEREVAFALENRNMPADEMRPIVDTTLEIFNLTSMKEKLVWQLSGGEKQRLSLAGLLAASPDILFLDEPASFLDVEGSRKLDDTLKQITQSNPEITIIRVTQFSSVAAGYGRVLVMGKGAILKDIAPQELFQDVEFLKSMHIVPPLKFLTPTINGLPEQKPVAEAEKADIGLLEVDRISFGYENHGHEPLFQGVSFALKGGEVVAITGPSGAGKSTLAQVLCGIYDPHSGSLLKAEADVRTALCFQQPERQFFHSTVYDEIAFGVKRKIQSDALIKETVGSSLETVGLDPEIFASRDPHSLSGGEARRLAFAVVIALDPDVIIFDEPTCGLDDEGTSRFAAMISRLKDQGKAIIIISHNGDLVGEMADRVLLLKDGRQQFWGDTLTFFNSNKHHGILELPQVMAYQQGRYGQVVTSRVTALFNWNKFNA